MTINTITLDGHRYTLGDHVPIAGLPDWLEANGL